MDSKERLCCDQDAEAPGRPHNDKIVSKKKTNVVGKVDSNGNKIETVDKSALLKRKQNRWVVVAFFCSFALSIFMSTISESVMEAANNLIVTIAVVLVIVFISIVFDIIGTAVTAADVAPINAMNSKRLFGADFAMILLKNADRVSNICNDIIGDICGVVSGVASSYIVALVARYGTVWDIIGSLSVPALVGALTVAGKAYGKRIAMGSAKTIVFKFGVLFALCNCFITKLVWTRKKKYLKKKKHDFSSNGKGVFRQAANSLKMKV